MIQQYSLHIYPRPISLTTMAAASIPKMVLEDTFSVGVLTAFAQQCLGLHFGYGVLFWSSLYPVISTGSSLESFPCL